MKALAEALENALGVLRGVQADCVGGNDDIRWEVIKTGMASPSQVTLSPQENEKSDHSGREVLKSLLQGIELIERSAAVPPQFSGDTLEAVKKFVKEANEEGVTLAVGTNGKNMTTLTANTIRHIEEMIQGFRSYADLTTIEGRLEMVSVHGGRKFWIWEILTERRIECVISEEQFATVVAMLDKRVAVTGQVKYKNHVPMTISVQSIKAMRDMADLPQPKDIGPIQHQPMALARKSMCGECAMAEMVYLDTCVFIELLQGTRTGRIVLRLAMTFTPKPPKRH